MGYSTLASTIVNFGTAKSNSRNQKICKITPHHMAGNMGAEECARYHLYSSRQASANYYIGTDGEICGGVDETRRAWTSSSEWNDQRAITIEVANDSYSPYWTVSDKAYRSLVKLCADICKRYKIEPYFDGTQYGSITYHSMYAATGCPGPYLQNLIDSRQFEQDVRAEMSALIYRVHQQTYGWLPWVGAGEVAGFIGRSKRAESIILESKHSIEYMVHQQTYGDSEWYQSGQQAGVTGQSKRLEGFAVKCNTPGKRVRYKGHLQSTGWTDWVYDGAFCGTRGEARRLEAIIVEII